MQARAFLVGRIGRDPERRIARNGKPWVTTCLAVDVSNPEEPRQEPWWLNMLGFGKMGAVLEAHEKGDLVTVSGRISRRYWTDETGTQREAWYVHVDGMLSARTLQPKTKHPSGGAYETDFDDALPF